MNGEGTICGIDHVVVGVPRGELAPETPLEIQDGGRHEGLGTENSLALFRTSYLELISVRDPVEAEQGQLMAPLVQLLERIGSGWVGHALLTKKIEEVEARARQYGLPARIVPASRLDPQGIEISWRMCFIEGLPWGSAWPFIIQWDQSPPRMADSPVDLAGVILREKNPEHAARMWHRAFDLATPPARVGGGWQLELGAHRILIEAGDAGVGEIVLKGSSRNTLERITRAEPMTRTWGDCKLTRLDALPFDVVVWRQDT